MFESLSESIKLAFRSKKNMADEMFSEENFNRAVAKKTSKKSTEIKISKEGKWKEREREMILEKELN